MKVENHDGKGNPYHNDATGQFSSGSSNGVQKRTINTTPFKKINLSSNAGNEIKRSQPLPESDRNILKQSGIYDEFKEKQKENTTKKFAGGHDIKVENLPKKGSTIAANSNDIDFQQIMHNLSSSTLAKMIKFVLRGFDFNVFKKKNGRLNRKVFNTQKKVEQTQQDVKQPIVPKKVSDNEMQQLHQEGRDLINRQTKLKQQAWKEWNDAKIDLHFFKKMKDDYQKKFGNNQKQFQNWYRKSNLFKNILVAQDKIKKYAEEKENPSAIRDEMEAYKKKEQDIKDRILKRNQMLKK